jgi:serine/threonine protein phosphatase PrpC
MRKENAKVRTHFTSEAGNSLLNRDFFAFAELENFACYVLVDGISEDTGKSAETAVMEALRLFSDAPSIRAGKLSKLLEKVNNLLAEKTKDASFEASIMLLATDYANYRYAQAGNVRLCHMRNGAVLHESLDMSLAAILSGKGEIPKDKVAEHIERHNLSSFLGQRTQKFLPYVSKKRKLEDGDALALYSRGVWEKLSVLNILEALNDASSPEDWTNAVEGVVLGPAKNTEEDYSFVSIFVDKIYENAENRKKLIKKILMIGIPILVILLVLGITLFVRHNIRQSDTSAMNDALSDAKAAAEINDFTRASEKVDEAYSLAQKLKLSEEKQDLSDLTILFSHIIAGDEAMNEGDFTKATEEFKAANKKSYYANLQSADYIAARIKLAANYADIHDLLDRGDAASDDGDYEFAEEYYAEARTIAATLAASDETKRARDGVKEVRALAAEQTATDLKAEAQRRETRGDENPAVAAEEYLRAAELYKQAGDTTAEALVRGKIDKMEADESEEAKNTAVAQAQAAEMNGDMAFGAHNYALAREQYMSAQSIYAEYGMTDLSGAVAQKLIQVFSAEQGGSAELERAAGYMRDGDASFVKGENAAARLLYQTARDIYKDLGLLEEMEKAQGKMDQVDKRLESVQ